MIFNLTNPEEIQIRESRGLVKDIYDPAVAVREPLSSYRTMLDLVHRDPTLATAYDILVEFVTYRGFDFIGGNRDKRDELRVLFDDLNFQQVLPNLVYSLLYYGDAYLELRKNNSKVPNELWVLETTEMRIMHDEHGKIVGYVQRAFNMNNLTLEEVISKEMEIDPVTGKTFGIFFKEEEVIHFRMKWIGSQVYSYNPNEPLSTVASTKVYAGNYLMQIFLNMPPRYVAHLAGISPKDYDVAKKEFQSAKTNYKKTIAFSRSSDPNSKLTLQKIDPPYDETLIAIMKYLNNEILKLTRVPKTWIEGSDSENRGVGESLNLPFEVHVQSIHRTILEPLINRKLLKALGYYKKSIGSEKYLELRFNEISRKGEMEILQNCATLQGLGLKPEAMVTYLDERGILGLDPDDFQDPMQMQMENDMAMTAMKTGANPPAASKNKDLYPSRQRMNKSTDNMTQNRNEAGVSDSSGKKMGIK